MGTYATLMLTAQLVTQMIATQALLRTVLSAGVAPAVAAVAGVEGLHDKEAHGRVL